uniref:C-type lectin domain-containing protein n=1 Tax=Chelydra serpentina TaxID=8475 RepID=A0A8C3SZT7_CHESE
MHLHQPFKALVLAVALMMASGVDINKHEEHMNACPVIQCCAPGTNGLPGRDRRDGREGPKGEKGDQGLRGLQGFPGKAGPQGEKGDQGPQGEKGQKGESAREKSTLSDSGILLVLGAASRMAQQSESHGVFSLWWVKSVGKKIFMLMGTKDSFENGKTLCAKAGAYLGMSDVHIEGKFMYLNGEPVTYRNWDMGESNNKKNEDCVIMYYNGKWNDMDCSNSEVSIICEF